MLLAPCKVEFLKGGYVKLLADVPFLIRGVRITAHAGYVWNMASIPKFLRGIVGCPSDLIGESLLHDLIYESGIYPRETADLYLYLILRSGGQYKDEVDKLRAKAIYAGVRTCGAPYYKSGNVSAAREFVSIELI